MHAASETCPFLAFFSFSVCRYRALLSSRFAGCFYARFGNGSAQSCATLSASGRFEAFLSARFDSAISHHMAHGLDNPQGRTCNLPCQEKALESLPRCSFPDRMCANQQPRRRTGAVFICRLSAVWSAARVCRHGWFDSKGGFYTPVAQVVEQRSPKPHVAGSSPAGSACVPYEGAAQ